MDRRGDRGRGKAGVREARCNLTEVTQGQSLPNKKCKVKGNRGGNKRVCKCGSQHFFFRFRILINVRCQLEVKTLKGGKSTDLKNWGRLEESSF